MGLFLAAPGYLEPTASGAQTVAHPADAFIPSSSRQNKAANRMSRALGVIS